MVRTWHQHSEWKHCNFSLSVIEQIRAQYCYYMAFLTQSFSTVPCSKLGTKAKWLDTNIKTTFQTHAQIQEREERKPATLTPSGISLWSETLAWIGKAVEHTVCFSILWEALFQLLSVSSRKIPGFIHALWIHWQHNFKVPLSKLLIDCMHDHIMDDHILLAQEGAI